MTSQTNSITDQKCLDALAAYNRNNQNASAASRELGIKHGTYRRHLAKAFARNFDKRFPNLTVPTGMEITGESTQYDADGDVRGKSVKISKSREGQFKLPEKHHLKAMTTQVDGNGDTVQAWYKTDLEKQGAQIFIDGLKEEFLDYERPKFKLDKPKNLITNRMTFYPLPDMHLGLFAWGQETGTDWDIPIAMDAYQTAMQRVHHASNATETAVILGGGDLLHADNSENRTLKSGNTLDVDTRYAKVLGKAGELLTFQIELALQKHKKVTVRILPGNHDEHSAIAMTWFLHAWYRNEKRVVIDTDPSLFWHMEFGKVMLAATHGHAAKLDKMPEIMSSRWREIWGRTKHAYAHGFHVHHKTQRVFEGGGAITESHQAPVTQDAYHHQHGYLAGRSLSSIEYDAEFGEVGRARITL